MDEQTSGPAGPEDVIIAVEDPELEQEAATVVAATGRRAVRDEAPDPADAAYRRCAAVLLDASRAAGVEARAGGSVPARRSGVFLLHGDGAEPDLALAGGIGAEDVIALPACGVELVLAIGRPGADSPGRRVDPPGGSRRTAPAPGSGQSGEWDGHRSEFGDAGWHAAADGAEGRIVAVTGAVGGAGTSTAAVALALLAAREDRTLLVDAIEWSGGADLLLGAEAEPGVRWPDVRADSGRLDATALFDAVPIARARGGDRPGPGVLTGPRSRSDDGWTITPRAVAAVSDAVVAAGGTAVVDMPAVGAIAETIAPRADALAVVVPATVRGIAAAARRAQALRRMGGDPVAVLRYPSPGGVTADDVTDASGLDVVAEIPHLRGLPREAEIDGIGRSAGALMRALAPVLDLAEGRAWDR